MKYGLLTIAFGAAFCLAYEGVDQWKWSEKGQGSVAIKGVCSIEPSEVTCWDKDGKRSTKLEKSLAADLVKGSVKVEARYGTKNRYLVADIKNELNNMGINFATDAGSAYQTGKLVLLSTPTTSKEATLKIAYRTVDKHVGKLAPKEGGKFSLGEMSVEIVKITPSKASGQAFGIVTGRDIPLWRLNLDAKGGDLNKMRLKAISQDGKEFGFVDGNGKPIPGKTALSKDNPVMPVMQLMHPFGGAGWYIDTNIDPGKLKSIEFQTIQDREYKIENIPLDPKK